MWFAQSFECLFTATVSGWAYIDNSVAILLMWVGFMAVLPHPFTDYATVRKSMINFQSFEVQLNQDVVPIFCDEGVFHLVVNIMLNEPDFLRTCFEC